LSIRREYRTTAYNYIQKGAVLYRTEWCAISCATLKPAFTSVIKQLNIVDYLHFLICVFQTMRIHVDKIHVGFILISSALSKNPRGFYVAYLCDSDVDFTGCFCRVVKYHSILTPKHAKEAERKRLQSFKIRDKSYNGTPCACVNYV